MRMSTANAMMPITLEMSLFGRSVPMSQGDFARIVIPKMEVLRRAVEVTVEG